MFSCTSLFSDEREREIGGKFDPLEKISQLVDLEVGREASNPVQSSPRLLNDQQQRGRKTSWTRFEDDDATIQAQL